jgi:hypothetical protein
VVAVPVLVFVAFLMVLPLFSRERGSHINACLSNVKNISLSLQMYVVDNNDHFPPARDWCDVLDEYVKNRDVFRCPQAQGKSGWDYAYNSLLSSRSMYDLVDPSGTVAIFESDAGRNASGDRKLLPAVPRHLGGDSYGFADGDAARVKRKAWGTDKRGNPNWLREPERPLRWQP